MTLLLVLLQVVLALAVLSVVAALVVAAVLAVNGRVDGRELLQIALGEDRDGGARLHADSGVLGVRERLQRPGR
ncbi:MAG: hypothetical protein AVDCRST_MAG35-1754 [uncultured Quadrisphaera sp.]|uniref:Uncharacterized protein n=1 Tax=uncultured Quadrisphaera sp. TaxID=904978 RepID=A0A6J4PMA9_9ACTN|nr:MAG: hypothetical protein AVDCRST_MAG35-1754 [uncultured Quadrisphaera sp.]